MAPRVRRRLLPRGNKHCAWGDDFLNERGSEVGLLVIGCMAASTRRRLKGILIACFVSCMVPPVMPGSAAPGVLATIEKGEGFHERKDVRRYEAYLDMLAAVVYNKCKRCVQAIFI